MSTLFFPGWAIPPESYERLANLLGAKVIFDYMAYLSDPFSIPCVPFHLPQLDDPTSEPSLLETFDLPPETTLVGHSMGAAIALQLALRQPERVKQLILLSPFARFTAQGTVPGQPPDAVAAMIRQVERAPVTMTKGFYRTAFFPEKPLFDPPAAMDPRQLRTGLEFLAQYDVTEALQTLPKCLEVIVLHTPQDRIVTLPMTQFLCDQISHCKVELFPEYGHLFPVTRPQAVFNAITDLKE